MREEQVPWLWAPGYPSTSVHVNQLQTVLKGQKKCVRRGSRPPGDGGALPTDGACQPLIFSAWHVLLPPRPGLLQPPWL